MSSSVYMQRPFCPFQSSYRKRSSPVQSERRSSSSRSSFAFSFSFVRRSMPSLSADRSSADLPTSRASSIWTRPAVRPFLGSDSRPVSGPDGETARQRGCGCLRCRSSRGRVVVSGKRARGGVDVSQQEIRDDHSGGLADMWPAPRKRPNFPARTPSIKH